MKNFSFNQLLCLLAIIVAFYSCSPERSNYVDLIPGDAGVVFTMNHNALNEKANIKENDYNFMNLITEELKVGSPGIAALIKGSENDAMLSGVDPKENYYFFTRGAQVNSMQGLVFKISNAEEFEGLVKKMFTELTSSECEVKEDGFKYVRFSDTSYYLINDYVFTWESDRALIAWSPKYTFNTSPSGDILAAVKSLYENTCKNSIRSEEAFDDFLQTKDDFSFLLNYGSYASMGQASAMQMMPFNFGKISELLEGSYAIYSMNFEKGEIVGDYKMYMGEKAKDIVDKYPVVQEFDASVLPNYFPKAVLGMFSMNLNFKNYYALLKEVLGPAMFNEVEMSFPLQTGFTIEELLGSLDGNILFTFSDLSKQGDKVDFKINAAVGLTKDNVNGKLESLMSKMSLKENGYYQIPSPSFSSYVAINDEIILFTTDINTAEAFVNGGLGDLSLNDSEYIKSIKNNCSYFFFDFEGFKNLGFFKSEVLGLIPFTNREAAEDMMDLFKYVEIKTNDDAMSGNMTLKMNTDKNALEAILEAADAFVE